MYVKNCLDSFDNSLPSTWADTSLHLYQLKSFIYNNPKNGTTSFTPTDSTPNDISPTDTPPYSYKGDKNNDISPIVGKVKLG